MIDKLANYLGYDFVQNALIAGTLAPFWAPSSATSSSFAMQVCRSCLVPHRLCRCGGRGRFGINLTRRHVAAHRGLRLFMAPPEIKSIATTWPSHVLSMSLVWHLVSQSLFQFAGRPRPFFSQHFWRLVRSNHADDRALPFEPGRLAIFSRRLLFASTQPRLRKRAACRCPALDGVHDCARRLVTLASQIVGILLVFTLIIAPAGIALRVCRSFWRGIFLSIALGVIAVWIVFCSIAAPATRLPFGSRRFSLFSISAWNPTAAFLRNRMAIRTQIHVSNYSGYCKMRYV